MFCPVCFLLGVRWDNWKHLIFANCNGIILILPKFLLYLKESHMWIHPLLSSSPAANTCYWPNWNLSCLAFWSAVWFQVFRSQDYNAVLYCLRQVFSFVSMVNSTFRVIYGSNESSPLHLFSSFLRRLRWKNLWQVVQNLQKYILLGNIRPLLRLTLAFLI